MHRSDCVLLQMIENCTYLSHEESFLSDDSLPKSQLLISDLFAEFVVFNEMFASPVIFGVQTPVLFSTELVTFDISTFLS